MSTCIWCFPNCDINLSMKGRLVKTKIAFEVTQTSRTSEPRRPMRDSGRVFIQMRMSRSPHIRESKNSWILDSTSWIPDSRYWIPIFFRGTSILESNRKWDSGFLEQKVPGPTYVGRSKLCWQDRELAKFGIETFLYLFSNLHWKTTTHFNATLSSLNRSKDTRPKAFLEQPCNGQC